MDSKKKTRSKIGMTAFDTKGKRTDELKKTRVERAKRKYGTSQELDKVKEEIKEEIKEEMKDEVRKVPIVEAGLVEIGGVEKERHDANVLRLEWAIKFPLLTPIEYLTGEKGYSVYQAQRILEVSGSIDEWIDEREKIVNGITETMVKRNIDKIVEMKEMFLGASKIALTKSIEMLSRLQIDPVRDEDGKLMIDPKTKKPVYRGFRSIDLLNCVSAIEKANSIMERVSGVKPELGLEQVKQLLEQNKQQSIQVNIQNNSVTLTTEEPKKNKLEEFVEKLSYDEMQEIIREKRRMRASGEIIDAEAKEIE